METVVMTDSGVLKNDRLLADVVVYLPRPGEAAHIYEMGIPVLATGDKFSVDVQVKVPMNAERDNVSAYYLMITRAIALNHGWQMLSPEEASAAWVGDALESYRTSKDAVNGVLALRFGERRVREDSSDPEATKTAMSRGYTVVPHNTFSSTAWAHIQEHGALVFAGELMPSHRPFHKDGTAIVLLPESEWSSGMVDFARTAQAVAAVVIGVPHLKVLMANDPGWKSTALAYGPGGPLYVNVLAMGDEWFERGFTREQRADLIHELAHETSPDHLSASYHKELCRIGAELSIMAQQGELL